GILTAFPAEATEIFRALIEKQRSDEEVDKKSGFETWEQFMQSFEVQRQVEPPSSKKAPTSKGPNSRDQKSQDNARVRQLPDFPRPRAQRWTELFAVLERIKKDHRKKGVELYDRPYTQFSKWAKRIARYSFQSGRVLADERVESSVAA